MAEKERQNDADTNPDIRPRSGRVLRAKDIIPGAGRTAGQDEGASQFDIPQFDLAEDIMSEQRRLSASRRKRQVTEERKQMTEDRGQKTHSYLPISVINHPPSRWDPVIADIVARDIERFCRSGSWS